MRAHCACCAGEPTSPRSRLLYHEQSSSLIASAHAHEAVPDDRNRSSDLIAGLVLRSQARASAAVPDVRVLVTYDDGSRAILRARIIINSLNTARFRADDDAGACMPEPDDAICGNEQRSTDGVFT